MLATVVAVTGACAEPRNVIEEVDAATSDARFARVDGPESPEMPPPPPTGRGFVLGAMCESADQCGSGSCVDGRCCGQNACGVCQRCGSGGRCAPIADEEDDDTCRAPSRCNSAGLCVRPFLEYMLPAGWQPDSLTGGPDGNLWMVQSQGAKVARMSQAGAVTDLSVLDPAVDRPRQILAGPDGNLWITLPATSKVARLNPSGTVVQFDLRGTEPQAIAVGPDGNLWVTQLSGPGLGRLTPAGVYLPVMLNDFRAFTLDLTSGSDGNLWVLGNASIARVTVTGLEMRFPLPFMGAPLSIVAGADSALWFTVPSRRSIGRLSTAGVVSELVLPENGEPFDIVAHPDGVLWFTMPGANALSRLTTNGTVSRFTIPTPDSRPTHLTIGPDRAIWFVESAAGKIGRFRM